MAPIRDLLDRLLEGEEKSALSNPGSKDFASTRASRSSGKTANQRFFSGGSPSGCERAGFWRCASWDWEVTGDVTARLKQTQIALGQDPDERPPVHSGFHRGQAGFYLREDLYLSQHRLYCDLLRLTRSAIFSMFWAFKANAPNGDQTSAAEAYLKSGRE